MQKSKISVIVSFFKGNRYINNLLESIDNACKFAKMSKQDVEVIIINDSPNEKVKYNTKRNYLFILRILNNKTNIGIQKTRILGVNEANSEYLLIIDQDDEISKTFFSSQMQYIDKADVILGNGVCQVNSSYKAIYKTKKIMDFAVSSDGIMCVRNLIPSPGQCLIRKSSIPKYWKEHTLKCNGADDWMLWILMKSDNNIFTTNTDKVYIKNETGYNLSSDEDKMAKSCIEMYKILSNNKLIASIDNKHLKETITLRYILKNKLGKAIYALMHLNCFLINLKYKLFYKIIE